MKIILNNTIKPKIVKCEICGSILEIEKEDICVDYKGWMIGFAVWYTCQACGYTNELPNEPYGEKAQEMVWLRIKRKERVKTRKKKR